MQRDEVVVSLAGDRQAIARLLDSVISASRELRLREVLRRIVGYACVLTDARIGALGVGAPGQDPVEVIYHGPEDEREFPPKAPVLGAELRIQDEVIGHLYVAGKAEYTDEDRENVVALATAAAISVENTQTYELGRQRERWLRASNEITAALLEGGDTGGELRLVTELARTVAGTPVAALAVAHDDPDKLVFQVIDGLGEASQALVGETIDVSTTASGVVFSTGEPLLLDQYGDAASRWHDDYNGGAPPLLQKLGAAAIVPLAAGDQTLGVLLLIKMRGEPPFTDGDLQLLRNFAGHAALALQSAKARADQRRLAVFEERDRIATDMQDLVIRRLFDISLGLQGLAPLVDARVWRRIASLVDNLDGTIREVRRSIFSLQDDVNATGEAPASLVDALSRILTQAEETLGFAPLVSLDEQADSLVPQRIRPDLLATAREALSNVARHARASTVSVTLCAGEGELTLTVADDGVGIPDSRARNSGLANLNKRARRWGGELSVERGAAGGTKLAWTVPLVEG